MFIKIMETDIMSLLDLMDYTTDRFYIVFDEEDGKKQIKEIFTKLFNDYKKGKTSNSLAKSEVIVAFGRGYHPEKGIEDILTIAKKLNAHYATTRPIQDMGLVDESKVLGKTALSVSPKLYIAFGLSGSVQHLGSVNASEIIAINNNKNSAIFRHAKFAILGDARDVAHFIANI